MTQTSQPPPPTTSRGNLKYILIGLLFLGAGGVISWLAAGNQQPPPAAPAPAPPPEPERANPMAEQNLVLEEEKPAEEPKPEPEPTPTHKSKGQKMGEWDCSGDVATATAMKVINENRAQIRSCYERRLKVNNILQGDMNLRLKVGSSGRVVATSVTGSLKDSQVFSCVRNIAQLWTFAAPTGGNCAIVAVPFAFSPKQ